MGQDFNSIHSRLQPALQQLEQQRRLLKEEGSRKGLIMGGICFVGGSIFALYGGFNVFGIAIALAVAGMIWYYCVQCKSAVLTVYYKQNIISAIVRELCENATFEPENGIPEAIFGASRLFSGRADRYHSEDLISGQVDKTVFNCAEIVAEEKRVTTDKNGHTRTYWVDIFRGFFFIADFQKDFQGQTVIYRNSWLKLGNYGQRVKLENPEFEKSFDTYSTDQVEARYLLSPVMMERLLELDQKFPGKITVSFLNSRVIVAIPDAKDHFEASIWQSQLQNDSIREEFYTLTTLLSIINDLNLNVRIWSKA